jgi:hypothetical protein
MSTTTGPAASRCELNERKMSQTAPACDVASQAIIVLPVNCRVLTDRLSSCGGSLADRTAIRSRTAVQRK